MTHPKDCPPHIRVVYCDGCHEYVELYGIICNGPHLGDAACASVPSCPRCSDTASLEELEAAAAIYDRLFEANAIERKREERNRKARLRRRRAKEERRRVVEPEWCSHCNG